MEPVQVAIVNEPLSDTCMGCGSPYTNIGHPLKPGVIMQRVCKCKYESETVNGVTFTRLVPP